jgi:hypothetical protein
MRTRYLHGPRGPWRRCFYCQVELRAYDKFTLFCDYCEAERRPPQARAKDLVRNAIRAGRMAPATGQPCKDCGAPATRYDHRDYSKPFTVEPVCSSCNSKRGPAKAPVGLI